jgi:DNA-binding LytR/AlgR family response regulator
MDFSCQRDKTIILKEKGKIQQIAIEKIVFVECDGYLLTVHTNDTNSPLTFSLLLKQIEEKVNGYGFCRINRNIIVNMKYFDSYVSGKKRCFKTTTGVEMNVSRRKWCVLKETIQE